MTMINIRDFCKYVRKDNVFYKQRIRRVEAAIDSEVRTNVTVSRHIIRDWIRSYIIYALEDRCGLGTLLEEDVDHAIDVMLPYFLEKYKDVVR